MTTSIPPNLRHHFPQWNALPEEVKATVCEKAMESAGKEAEQRNPSITPEQAALASARALARLKLVSKAFEEWQPQILAKHSNVGMETTRGAINTMVARNLSAEEFGQKMDRLLAQNRHVSIDLLPPQQHQIVLEKLSGHTRTPLHNVNLNFSCPEGAGRRFTIGQLKEVMDALSCMNRNHPELQIGLNLSDHHLGVRGPESAALIAAALREYKLIRLNLFRNFFGNDGVNTIAEALPESKATDLNLGGNAITNSAKTLIDALPELVTSLNLNGNYLDADGAKHLANRLHQTEITILDLSRNGLGIDGVKAIIDALQQSKVTHLNLSRILMPTAYLMMGIPADHPVVQAIINALFQSKVIDLDVSHIYFRPEATQAIRTAGSEAGRQRNEAIRVALTEPPQLLRRPVGVNYAEEA